MKEIVRRLQKGQEQLLQSWRQRLLETRASPNVHSLTGDLSDHLSRFLEITAERLLMREDQTVPELDIVSPVRRHGFGLTEVINEWVHLQDVLFDYLRDLAVEQNLSAPELARATKTVARTISEGIRISTLDYNGFAQRVALARVRELERVVAYHDRQQRERSLGLRSASHDLRGALAAIQSVADLLEQSHGERQEIAELVELLQLSTGELESMLTSLLELSRLEAGLEKARLEMLDVSDELSRLCRTLKPLAAEKQLAFSWSGTTPLPVSVDPAKVRRIAQNLILNAIRYTDEGEVQVRWHADPDCWWLTVIDTGAGMPVPGAAPSSAAESSGGEGVGLLIVRRLCELLGGRLDIQSEIGAGTTVEVRFLRRPTSPA
ncbi:MAG: HAMP domain-containing histidine kinase [Armatimonadetes bacterium]|nr:HAMP domain-containing histidine kinase [Armatimonadota bacterium]